MALITPPNIDPATFAKALSQLIDIVGPDWVFTDPQAELSPYLDRMSPTPAELRIPSAAVAPANVEQTQQIVRLANRLKIPIWYYGTGKNYGYGGPAPRLNGFLVVDMKRMNKVLEVNEKMAYAVVEPGVSYIQLYQHLQEIGSDLWIDCAAPAWGALSAMPWNMAPVTPLTVITLFFSAVWRYCSQTAVWSVPAWAPCLVAKPVHCSNMDMAPISTACSPRAILALSLRWVFG